LRISISFISYCSLAKIWASFISRTEGVAKTGAAARLAGYKAIGASGITLTGAPATTTLPLFDIKDT
jgi:hypothetical protein